MYQILFKNRFIALVFVAMIVLGVRTLIGTEGDAGLLTSKTAEIEANVQALHGEAQHFQARPEEDIVTPEPAVTAFAPDEDLIEDAEGMEPEGQPTAPDAPGPVEIEIPPDMVIPDDPGDN